MNAKASSVPSNATVACVGLDWRTYNGSVLTVKMNDGSMRNLYMNSSAWLRSLKPGDRISVA